MTHIEMTTDMPVACSLTADRYRRRVADAGALTRDALQTRRTIDGGARLTFTDTKDVRIRLEKFIAAEAACCPFLTMSLRPEDGSLVLDVAGPPDAAAIIRELFT